MVGTFQSGSGTYTCRCCKKKTRETGYGESDVDLCKMCLWEAEDFNAYQDGKMTWAQYEEKWKDYPYSEAYKG